MFISLDRILEVDLLGQQLWTFLALLLYIARLLPERFRLLSPVSKDLRGIFPVGNVCSKQQPSLYSFTPSVVSLFHRGTFYFLGSWSQISLTYYEPDKDANYLNSLETILFLAWISSSDETEALKWAIEGIFWKEKPPNAPDLRKEAAIAAIDSFSSWALSAQLAHVGQESWFNWHLTHFLLLING